jgi:hypothetical protein
MRRSRFSIEKPCRAFRRVGPAGALAGFRLERRFMLRSSFRGASGSHRPTGTSQQNRTAASLCRQTHLRISSRLKRAAAEKTKTLLAEGRGVDQQQLAGLLKERFDERLGDDEALRAIYERLAKRHRRKYAPGSLCELEMIEWCFRGKKAISVHVLSDEWLGRKLDARELKLAGAESGQSLEGETFLIEKGDYSLTEHGRKVRSVKAWIKFQLLVMRGCRKPWIKKQRNDTNLPILHPLEYVQRIFFARMEWDGKLIEAIYFNLKSRRVFFRFAPSSTESSDEPDSM